MAQMACSTDLPKPIALASKELPKEIDFNIHVKPILSDKCYACHGPDKANQKAGLRLDQAEAAFAELPESPGKFAIVPKRVKRSEVFHRIISDSPEQMMPPAEFKVELSDYEKAMLIRWIEEGAEYKPHWAFAKPEKPNVPQLKSGEKLANPIDAFVRKKLEMMELEPAPQADRSLLLRRLSFDLTGLPPSLEEMEAFLADDSADAYEKQVDRLLSSVHYGEKIATDWMDLARYSDTYGYQVDRYRDMSPWRDWVIKSFNENRPYDQFITWQLAGDLLPNATREQVLATGFNRLHPQNMEDGIVGEEFRVENVSDRVAVLGDGLMGLTLSCAKCHDHKYDPISQKEYFELYSFFNNINETGQISWDKGTPVPTLLLPTKQQEDWLAQQEAKIKNKASDLEQISQSEQAAITRWVQREHYRQLPNQHPRKGLIGHYSLDRSPMSNAVNPRQRAKMERAFSKKEVPQFVEAYGGQGLQMDGDAWLNLQDVGVFRRSDAFSVGLWVFLPRELEEGVIFHKNKGTTLHSYRGFHLYVKDEKLQWVMARTYPENAIIEHTLVDVPRDKWVQLMVTYDGSSKAAGTRLYLNGEELQTEVIKDNLYKDIIFNKLVDIIYPKPIEPTIKVAGRWRGKGLKDAKIDEILVYDRQLSTLEVQQVVGQNQLADVPATNLKSDQQQILTQYYLTHNSSPYQTTRDELMNLRSAYVDSMEKVQEVMVMEEMEKPRSTFILNRGVYDDYGEAVSPNTPASVLPMPEDLPRNRLGLAQWLTHPDHPLTARVAVNRYWQNYFGRGLVKTAEDFGNQGELPSHPELLDWLAVSFVESGWDVKALQRMIVTSETYKQNSYTSPELLEKDKENIWLARGPSIRLTSEMMRDNALTASGLLNTKVGGESVRPYQPDGLWKMNFDAYVQDTGDKLYRRSFYTIWRRTIPNPTLATFDQPERQACTVRRQKTNTPLQALVLLNDPTFVEAAKVIGEKMTRQSSTEVAIQETFAKLTGRVPNPKELQMLLELQAKEYAVFTENPAKTKGWLETGAYEIDPKLDPIKIAANAVVASVILNGDATITKR
ncbi:MAG: DUF1553 domain-containing protein [Saprospiraceae bacterium]|nr:DUF1553 domain-containing protein [Saprospiraceae bacterium]